MRATIGLLVVAAWGLSLACHAQPPATPQDEVEPIATDAVYVESPGAATSVEPAPAPAGPESATGLEVCEEYLALYKRCEPTLKPQIMAGDRRPVDAERGWVEYVAGTPERAALPAACRDMLAELKQVCP